MVNFSFNNKVALITGAGTGIGFEIARQLAVSGAAVVLNDIELDAAKAASEKIKKEGGNCVIVPGDASNLEVIEQMVSKAVIEFGQVDLVIANAGITTFGSFLAYKLSTFQRLLAVNLQGSFFLAQAAAKQMIKQQTGGRILFLSSVTGHQAHPNLTAYGMTKAALEMLAKGLGVELAPHYINVNAIAPGATMTERTRLDVNYQESWERITPIGRVASTSDIAQAALFLLSDAARHITGQSLIVDGGWTAVSPPPT